VAGARCAGRGRLAVIFLVDPQPDPIRSAGRDGARAGDARALDRRPSAVPAARYFASGASADPAASAGGAFSIAAACSLDGRASDSPAGFASAGGAGASACFDGNAGDASPSAGACCLYGSTSDSPADSACADGASARHAGFASDDRAGARTPGSAHDNLTGALNDGSRGSCNR
jgi:hypothetical protein